MSDADDRDTEEFRSPKPADWRQETISSRTKVDLGASSHAGYLRLKNEDYFLVTRAGRSLHTLLTNLPAGTIPAEHTEIGYFMLVADGMGGAAGGEVASRTVISKLVELGLETPDWHMRLDSLGANEVLARMDQRVGKLREALVDEAQANSSLLGMGSTMTLAVSHGPNLVIVHIGDSRAYLFHQGKLDQLTRDQTVAQDLLEIGLIPPGEVARHPARHILTRAITTQLEEAQAEFHQVLLADGDQVLLCTDGLTEMVPETSIAGVLKKSVSAEEACRVLVDLALEAGGKDNVTVVVAATGYRNSREARREMDPCHFPFAISHFPFPISSFVNLSLDNS